MKRVLSLSMLWMGMMFLGHCGSEEPFCGDGVVNNGEACDEGGESADCDSDCTLVECGDGIVNEAAGESCEVTISTADCEAATCQAPVCGDGELNELAGEECDDGNLANNDGCSSGCEVERRVVFVSSEAYQGNLGGLAGADAKCAGLASTAGLEGTFMAWLSDGTNGPSTRFPASATGFTGDFVLGDGTLVANGWAGLTSGTLLHAIDINELSVPQAASVWTNTNSNGSSFGGEHCLGWSTLDGGGRIGLANSADSEWTNAAMFNPAACSSGASIYCFQVK